MFKYISKMNLSRKMFSTTKYNKNDLISRLLSAKESSNKTFDEIASYCNITNIYCANLFYNQAQLKPETLKKLSEIVPKISQEDLKLMTQAPDRRWDEKILQEPHLYRFHEAVVHNGEALKALVNEKFGDGIMSAIDFYISMDKIKGKSGEDRVVVTFNGKFLPYVEQKTENDTSKKN